MATSAEFFVSVQNYSDALEVRRKDDQLIVMEVQRDVPTKTYVQELNKHVKNDQSFLYAARISRDRLCVVLDKASSPPCLSNRLIV